MKTKSNMTVKEKPNNSWEIEKLNLVKEISKAMSYDYSEYDAMSNNDTPEEVAVNLLDKFLSTQREEIIKEIEGVVGEEENYWESTNDYEVCQIRNQFRKEIMERLKQITNLKEK